MKNSNSPGTSNSIISTFLILSFPIILFSCVSLNGIHESPTRFGYGINATPGLQIGESNTSAHAIVGYSRIQFDGGGGYNRIWEYGLQLRHALYRQRNNGLWIGGGASYLSIASVADGSGGSDPKAGSFIVGPVAGYRFFIGKIPASIYIAPSYLNVGQFKLNGAAFGASSSGFYAKFGLDFHLLSLLHDKGR